MPRGREISRRLYFIGVSLTLARLTHVDVWSLFKPHILLSLHSHKLRITWPLTDMMMLLSETRLLRYRQVIY